MTKFPNGNIEDFLVVIKRLIVLYKCIAFLHVFVRKCAKLCIYFSVVNLTVRKVLGELKNGAKTGTAYRSVRMVY